MNKETAQDLMLQIGQMVSQHMPHWETQFILDPTFDQSAQESKDLVRELEEDFGTPDVPQDYLLFDIARQVKSNLYQMMIVGMVTSIHLTVGGGAGTITIVQQPKPEV